MVGQLCAALINHIATSVPYCFLQCDARSKCAFEVLFCLRSQGLREGIRAYPMLFLGAAHQRNATGMPLTIFSLGAGASSAFWRTVT